MGEPPDVGASSVAPPAVAQRGYASSPPLEAPSTPQPLAGLMGIGSAAASLGHSVPTTVEVLDDAIVRVVDGAAKGKSDTVNIERIKLISLIDQKDSKLLHRIEEIKTAFEKAVIKANKIRNSDEKKTAEADLTIADLTGKHAAAKGYLEGDIKSALAEVKVKARAAATEKELIPIKASLGVVWKK